MTDTTNQSTARDVHPATRESQHPDLPSTTRAIVQSASGGVGTLAVQIVHAIGYVEEGDARGKVVVTT